MTKLEENRLIESLFYLYFNNRDIKETSTTEFWSMIRSICSIYKINNTLIITSLRKLMEPTNKPTDEEMMYLFTKTKLSVRDINNISKIYWQRQVEYKVKFNKGKVPVIIPKIIDVLAQKAMRQFINAVYNIAGIFRIIDKTFIDDIL